MTAVDELGDLLDELDRFPRDAVELVCGALADAIERQARTDTGGDFILSGAAKVNRGHKRTKLKVRVKITGSPAAAFGTVSAGPAKARAQWAWLDTGTDRHGRHPGTRAKHTFNGPADAVLPIVERRVAERFEIGVAR